MNYHQTLNYLFSRLPMYQRKGEAAYKADISNIVSATKYLRNPHHGFKSIHVAGTNGKGSVSHLLASIFQESGYKVGLYTSPHLKDFRERIKINGEMITEIEVVKFVEKNKTNFEKLNLSFFEFTVALAFYYFYVQKVDIAIIETGLGGRLDSTNIIKPELSIITNIGLDHTNLLGNSIQKIAYEKGGIIKEGVPIIIGRFQKETEKIFKDIAIKKCAPLIYATDHKLKSDLQGSYQKENINTATSAALEMNKLGWNITNENIQIGLLNTVKNTGIQGRWQKLGEKPLIICDTGHNEEGIKITFKQIKKIRYQNLHVVFGLTNDKDLDKILDILPKKAKYYFCKPNIYRGIDEQTIQNSAFKKNIKGKIFLSVKKAFLAAKKSADTEDLIFVGGSTFVVAEVI